MFHEYSLLDVYFFSFSIWDKRHDLLSPPSKLEGRVALRQDGSAGGKPLLPLGGAGVGRVSRLFPSLAAHLPGGALRTLTRLSAVGQTPARQTHLGRDLKLGNDSKLFCLAKMKAVDIRKENGQL